jgi:predicted SAM-dependent methyltransferase
MLQRIRKNKKIFDLVWAIRGLWGMTPEKKNKLFFQKETKNIIPNYLNQYKQVRKLNIGAQIHTQEGWLSVDIWPAKEGIAYMDATKPFPLENDSFDYIFSEHMIEHISLQDGFFMLKECYRILKLGGQIRIATPCMDYLIEKVNSQDETTHKYFKKLVKPIMAPNINIGMDRAYFINYLTYNYHHKFIYSKASLIDLLTDAGFKNIKTYQPKQSNDENLKNMEIHHQYVGEEINNFETIVVEAEK